MEIQREFDYRPPTGSLKLLGVLCLVMAPLTIAMAISGEVKEFSAGRYGAYTVSGPAAPWVMGLFGVLCAVAGYLLLKGGRQTEQTVGRIAFLPHNFLVNWRKVDTLEGARPYKDISHIAVNGKGRRAYLIFQFKDMREIVYAKGMNSTEEFDEMCEELRRRVEAAHTAATV